MAGAGKDLPENAMICVINREEYQNSLALTERNGSREPVQFNGHTLGWNTSCLLNSGDQIVFLSVSELCLDAPAVDDPDKLLANTLFEAVFNESRNSPFILFVKDADKVMAGNSELYSTIKSRLKKLPDNVITVGSHAHTNNHKEKDEALLSIWKQQLDQDADTLKKENFNTLQTLQRRLLDGR